MLHTSFFVHHFHITEHLGHSGLLGCSTSFDSISRADIAHRTSCRTSPKDAGQINHRVLSLFCVWTPKSNAVHAKWCHTLVQWLLYTSAL